MIWFGWLLWYINQSNAKFSLYSYIRYTWFCLFVWVLWHINHCSLFYAKSSLYLYIKYTGCVNTFSLLSPPMNSFFYSVSIDLTARKNLKIINDKISWDFLRVLWEARKLKWHSKLKRMWRLFYSQKEKYLLQPKPALAKKSTAWNK